MQIVTQDYEITVINSKTRTSKNIFVQSREPVIVCLRATALNEIASIYKESGEKPEETKENTFIFHSGENKKIIEIEIKYKDYMISIEHKTFIPKRTYSIDSNLITMAKDCSSKEKYEAKLKELLKQS